jgi:hypothetical protein
LNCLQGKLGLAQGSVQMCFHFFRKPGPPHATIPPSLLPNSLCRPYKPPEKAGAEEPQPAAAAAGGDEAAPALPGAPPAPAPASEEDGLVPDAAMLSMLRREVLLTRAKLHYLGYQQLMAERMLRSLKAQLRQVCQRGEASREAWRWEHACLACKKARMQHARMQWVLLSPLAGGLMSAGRSGELSCRLSRAPVCNQRVSGPTRAHCKLRRRTLVAAWCCKGLWPTCCRL